MVSACGDTVVVASKFPGTNRGRPSLFRRFYNLERDSDSGYLSREISWFKSRYPIDGRYYTTLFNHNFAFGMLTRIFFLLEFPVSVGIFNSTDHGIWCSTCQRHGTLYLAYLQIETFGRSPCDIFVISQHR